MGATVESARDYLVVDDEPLAAQAIAGYVRPVGTVCTPTSLEEAVSVLDRTPPKIGLLCDVNMSNARRPSVGDADLRGLLLVLYAKRRYPWLRGWLVTVVANDFVRACADVFGLGLLEKPTSAGEVQEALRAQPTTTLQTEAKRLAAETIRQAAQELHGGKVTKRQREIIDLLVQGHDPASCRNQLGIAENTYYNHTKAIIETLGIDDMTHYMVKTVDLATVTLAHGLLRLRQWVLSHAEDLSEGAADVPKLRPLRPKKPSARRRIRAHAASRSALDSAELAE